VVLVVVVVVVVMIMVVVVVVVDLLDRGGHSGGGGGGLWGAARELAVATSSSGRRRAIHPDRAIFSREHRSRRRDRRRGGKISHSDTDFLARATGVGDKHGEHGRTKRENAVLPHVFRRRRRRRARPRALL
jgi:hypothetical protein